jgi:cyclopropane fatty-acyl-phospholipid synthase-like methyltransferase
MTKPFSQACENNKQPILSVLEQVFSTTSHVLEVGSGTGQHAVFFADKLPHITWQTSELLINHAGINQWLTPTPLANLRPPILLDLNYPWPVNLVDGIFSANTLHIVSWPLVEKFFAGVARHLSSGGVLCVYGPFNYQGQFTSPSNADFDLWLKGRDSLSGIRDIEAVEQLAQSVGLSLDADHQMPANNRLLVFIKN